MAHTNRVFNNPMPLPTGLPSAPDLGPITHDKVIRPRPRNRPTTPLSSPRPQPRLSPRQLKDKAVQEEIRRTSSSSFGNTEFGFDLKTSGSQDLVSELGYQTKLAVLADQGLRSSSFSYTSQDKKDPTGMAKDTVVYMEGVGDKPVWNHEFRHAGMNVLLHNLTREDVVQRLGERAGKLFDVIRRRAVIMKDGKRVDGGEKIVEVFDRPGDKTPTLGEKYKKAGLPPMATIKDTIDTGTGTFMAYSRDGDNPKTMNESMFTPSEARNMFNGMALMVRQKMGRPMPTERKLFK